MSTEFTETLSVKDKENYHFLRCENSACEVGSHSEHPYFLAPGDSISLNCSKCQGDPDSADLPDPDVIEYAYAVDGNGWVHFVDSGPFPFPKIVPIALGITILFGLVWGVSQLFSSGPEVTLSNTTLEFSDVPLGSFKELTVDVANVGGKTLSLESDGDLPGFSLEFEDNNVLPGEETVITVSFSPDSEGHIEGEYSLNTNAKGGILIQVSGTGGKPDPWAAFNDIIDRATGSKVLPKP